MDPTTQAQIYQDALAASGGRPIAAYQLGESQFSDPKTAAFLQPTHADSSPSRGTTYGTTSSSPTKGFGTQSTTSASPQYSSGQFESSRSGSQGQGYSGSLGQSTNKATDSTRQTTQDVSDNAHQAAESTRQSAHQAADSTRETAQATRETAQNAAQATRDTAQNAVESTRQTANQAADSAKSTAQNVADSTRQTTQNIAESTRQTTASIAESTRQTTANIAESTRQTTQAAVTGLRKRVNSLSSQLENVGDIPAVQNAKGAAKKQVGQLRATLGRSPTIVDLEKRTGIDRVFLVVGGVLLYLLLIPLNLFGLALPTTALLTLLPPSILAVDVLESPGSNVSNDDDKFKGLLAYFVVLGFIQFLESLAAGVLAKTIPQYYTVKLLFLAYLLHPRTRGALKLHDTFFRPILQRANAGAPTSTPPTATSASVSSSPSQNPSAFVNQAGYSGTSTTSGAPFFPPGQEQAAAQLIAANLMAMSAANGETAHLPSGPGTGVGMEVPKQ